MQKDAFTNYLRYEKRLSPHSVLAYSSDLDQFYIYLKTVYLLDDIGEVNHSIIRSWVVSLMENKISARSVNRKISTLKSYYKFLLREKAMDINPMHKIQSPKNPKRLPVFVEESKMNALIEDVDFKNDFEGKRNLLIIELLYSTGMRRIELVNLKETDINFRNRTVKVLGKRNKERLIPLTPEIVILIKEYLEHRNISIHLKNDYLFLTKKGNHIYPGAVYRIVKGSLEKVTTLAKKSPHVLRHTFATHLLNNGANLNAIKELLGHANLAATQIYTHNTIEKLKSVYSKAHPKA
ncbi:MAG: integrase [Bacteroidetes bacterium]|nr:MAG: integrase [Bacteroidota bacterium]